MSRSGYSDDCEQWDLICWRGAVASAMRGVRGQAFLQEMRAAMDALPERKLIANQIEAGGAVCAIGAVGKRRGIDMTGLNPEDHEAVAAAFGIPHTFACEIFWMNDDGGQWKESPEDRFERVREWVDANIRKPIPLWFWHESQS